VADPKSQQIAELQSYDGYCGGLGDDPTRIGVRDYRPDRKT
jgi:hypothetical protein